MTPRICVTIVFDKHETSQMNVQKMCFRFLESLGNFEKKIILGMGVDNLLLKYY